MSSHDWEMLIRLLLAAFLGGIVGIERGSGDRPAGFRTHILVCAGAALFMLVSMYGYDDYPMHGEEFPRNRDSSRIAAQVVSGIGFLGAGTIMHEGVTVRGLTTAASLWMISAIGLLPVLGCMFKYWFYGGNDGYFGIFHQLGTFCRQQQKCPPLYSDCCRK